MLNMRELEGGWVLKGVGDLHTCVELPVSGLLGT